MSAIFEVTAPEATSSGASLRRRTWMWTRGPTVLQNVVLGIVSTSLIVEIIVTLRDHTGFWAVAGIVLTAGGVFAGLRWPWAGLVAVALGPTLATLEGHEPVAAWSIACFAAFLLTMRGMPGTLVGPVVAVGNLVATGLAAGAITPALDPVPSIAAVVALAMAAIGSSIRGHQQYWSQLEHRTREALATRQSAVDRAVAEERLRIARDLHDSIGHGIAVVNMHLGAAEVRLPAQATDSRDELHAARSGVQTVLAETQQILRVLRAASAEESLAPTPGHQRIPELVASIEAAGLTVDHRLSGLALTLPPQVSTAAYRIVQEALTNAHRHGAGPVSLRVEIDEHAVTIEAANLRRPGDDPASEGGGNGLVGIRERAASVGGRLAVSSSLPVFSIRAELPADTEETR